jgi:hypothetical protein
MEEQSLSELPGAQQLLHHPLEPSFRQKFGSSLFVDVIVPVPFTTTDSDHPRCPELQFVTLELSLCSVQC